MRCQSSSELYSLGLDPCGVGAALLLVAWHRSGYLEAEKMSDAQRLPSEFGGLGGSGRGKSRLEETIFEDPRDERVDRLLGPLSPRRTLRSSCLCKYDHMSHLSSE